MVDLTLGDYGVGIAYSLTRAGAPYGLDGHTVAFLFQKPSGATVEKSGSGLGNIASYMIDEGLIDERGWWTVTLRVTTTGRRLHARHRFRVV